jgi:hypothetical protein
VNLHVIIHAPLKFTIFRLACIFPHLPPVIALTVQAYLPSR